MRRALKIKTWLMLLSWMIIFLHGVIPHNHHPSQKAGCHHIVHNAPLSNEHHQDCDKAHEKTILYTAHSHESETICHFSTSLFQNLQIDSLFIVKSVWNQAYTEVPLTGLLYYTPGFKKPPAYQNCRLLRAPPYIA